MLNINDSLSLLIVVLNKALLAPGNTVSIAGAKSTPKLFICTPGIYQV